MEETQSLNYQSFGIEIEDMAINMTQFPNDEASFHVDSSKFLTGEMNGSDAGTVSLSSDLTSTWMNDFVMKGYEGIEEETAFEANAGLPDETDNENLVNGLGSVFPNWTQENSLNKFLLNPPDAIIDSKKPDAHNGRLIDDDFAPAKHFHLTKEMETCPVKQKTTMAFTSTDDIDGSVGAFHEIDQSIHSISKEQPLESYYFGATKRSHSTSKDMGCTQTYSKRKKAKAGDKLEGDELGTTNLPSNDSIKRVLQLTSAVGRGGNRNAKAKNYRGEKKLSSTFDDSSPVSSPEAEVPYVVDDDELISLETKELNKRVKFLPKSVVQEIKHRRRTLKNRGYARSCREKKMSETNTLQKSNGDLEKELSSKRLELELTMLERDDYKHKYEKLFAVCTKLGIRVEQ